MPAPSTPLAGKLRHIVESTLAGGPFFRRQHGLEYQPLAQLGEQTGLEGAVEGESTEDAPHEGSRSVDVKAEDLDTGAQLVAGDDLAILNEDIKRVRNKIDWHILPLMCSELLPGNVRSELSMCLCSSCQEVVLTHVCSPILDTIHGQDNTWECSNLGDKVRLIPDR